MMLFPILPYSSESVLTCGRVGYSRYLVRGVGFTSYSIVGPVVAPSAPTLLGSFGARQSTIAALALVTPALRKFTLVGFVFFANAQLVLKV